MSSRAPSRVQIARSQWLLGSTRPRAPTRSAGPGRSGWHAPTPTETPRGRVQPRGSRQRSTRRASCASGGSRPGRPGRSRCRPRPCTPEPSAPCALRRARPRRTARRSAPATSSSAPCRARPSPGACSSSAPAPRRGRRVELDDGSSAAPGELAPVAYGCPVCGKCAGPAVERPALRPCPECLEELVRLERSERAVEPALRGMRSRARAGRATAAELGDSGLEELARERFRWAEAVGRRPREERRGRILAAYPHAYALWAAGSTARAADSVRAPPS
jgi:hypothetical protein